MGKYIISFLIKFLEAVFYGTGMSIGIVGVIYLFDKFI